MTVKCWNSDKQIEIGINIFLTFALLLSLKSRLPDFFHPNKHCISVTLSKSFILFMRCSILYFVISLYHSNRYWPLSLKVSLVRHLMAKLDMLYDLIVTYIIHSNTCKRQFSNSQTTIRPFVKTVTLVGFPNWPSSPPRDPPKAVTKRPSKVYTNTL